MYHQINAAEMLFGERQRALLEEAESRRLARRLRAARRSTQGGGTGRLRRAAMVFATVVMALLVSATAALAEIKGGTDNAETIVGTNSADQIIGKGGNDTLKGLAANDTYHFDDGFGDDTLTETASVKVGKKKKPGGTDTLTFSQFDQAVYAVMVSQWAAQSSGYNFVFAGIEDTIVLGSSPVENVVGGSSGDSLVGGSAKNTYSGGPGGSDGLWDYGGDDGSAVSNPALPDLPASDDTYKGFTSGTGISNDYVVDYGGTADKLDLRPLESSDVYFDPFDQNLNGIDDSLRIIINDTANVIVFGHFSPTKAGQENGRMEQIIFSDQVVTSNAELNSLM